MAEAPTTGAHVADFVFRVLDGPTEELGVTGFTGTEGISELFHFRVELCCDNPALVLEDYLGKGCILEIHGEFGSRYVNGIVRRFDRTGEGHNLTYYAVEIVPAHWQLTRRINCRIFHEETCKDVTVPGIISQVLLDAGIAEDAFDLNRLNIDAYPTLEYVVQYNESDFDFVSRLAEQEGIFYFFEHTAAGHVMVFGDSTAAHKPIGAPESSQGASQQSAGPSQQTGGNGDGRPPNVIPYRDPNGLVEEQEFVFNVNARGGMEIGSVTLDDYNFQKSEVDLQTAPADAKEFTGLSVYSYPGGYQDEKEGKRYVAIRLAEQQCKRAVIHMSATARHLLPGFQFTLSEHANTAYDIDYLITQVVHRASQPQAAQEAQLSEEGSRYEVQCRTIPFAVPFCPPRVTRRPTVPGCQTATVVKQKGSDDEIYVDKFGRVKVIFHWDHYQKPEDSSMFIRVSQGWAGAGWGQMFIPRVGQEVIVDFLEGHPNRPVIVGRLYNSTHMPPYALPEERTKSTIKTNSTEGSKRYHEIRFEDKNKAEQLFIRAQRRMDTRIAGTHYHTAGGSLHERAGYVDENGEKHGRFYRTVKEGIDLHNEGNQYQLIDDIRQVRVEKDVLDAFMKNYALFVGDDIEINAKNIIIEMKQKIALKVGGNFIVIDSSGITIVGTKVKVNSGGSSPTVGDKEGLKPLDAIAADTGKPGRKGGGGSPRTREPYKLKPQKAPLPPKRKKKIPVPPPVPPPKDLKCAIITITARCEHKGESTRQVTQDMTLEVVPTNNYGWDKIELEAEVQMLCGPKHPEWSITGRSSKKGLKTDFNATGPVVSKLFPWIPSAKPNKYRVWCECCNGGRKKLDVWAYPNVELETTVDLKKLLETLRKITSVVEGLAEVAGAEKFSWKYLEGKASASAVWKEYKDHRAYYEYKLSAKFDPLFGIEVKLMLGTNWITGKVGKIPWLGKWVKKVVDWLVKAGVYLKLNGGIGCDVRFERTSPDQPKFTPNLGTGVGGKIGAALGVEGNVAGSKVISVEIEAGGSITGAGSPFVDDTGFGVDKFKVDFDGLKGTAKVKVAWWETGGAVNFIDSKNIWGPKKIYIYPPKVV